MKNYSVRWMSYRIIFWIVGDTVRNGVNTAILLIILILKREGNLRFPYRVYFPRPLEKESNTKITNTPKKVYKINSSVMWSVFSFSWFSNR